MPCRFLMFKIVPTSLLSKFMCRRTLEMETGFSALTSIPYNLNKMWAMSDKSDL